MTAYDFLNAHWGDMMTILVVAIMFWFLKD